MNAQKWFERRPERKMSTHTQQGGCVVDRSAASFKIFHAARIYKACGARTCGQTHARIRRRNKRVVNKLRTLASLQKFNLLVTKDPTTTTPLDANWWRPTGKAHAVYTSASTTTLRTLSRKRHTCIHS